MEKKTFVKKELVEALQKKYPKVLSSNIEKMTDSIFRFLSNKLSCWTQRRNKRLWHDESKNNKPS